MKADFEKGTKVCSKCKRELPISEFHRDKSHSDGLLIYCKRCVTEIKSREYEDKVLNTFGRRGHKRGNSCMIMRDYELTEEQLKRRNRSREKKCVRQKRENAQGLLTWYDGLLNNCSSKEYQIMMQLEYNRQRMCAIRGCIGREEPSVHFLFDFDLEQMLKDNVYYGGGRYKYYITKWWDGEIRHWTVNDGIWRE